MEGREIAGRYRIKSKLGEGGMGAVYKAEQISLKRVVALKLLKPELVSSQPLLRRFNAEAEAVAKLNHPNTVGIYDFGQDRDGTLFIAMEFVEGASLRGMLMKEGPFSPLRTLHIAGQIAASLSDAHAVGIIHRDLKPDNIMLQERGRQRDTVRVLDFGIAKLRDDSRMTQQSMTQAGDVLGTPQYMSPEQIRGEEIDGRADVYSLGTILYEMLTGRMVFEANTLVALLSRHLLDQPEPPSRRRPDLRIAADLDALVLGCLAKEPRARLPSMDRVTEEIARLAQAHGAVMSSSDALAVAARASGSVSSASVSGGSVSGGSALAPAVIVPTGAGMGSSMTPQPMHPMHPAMQPAMHPMQPMHPAMHPPTPPPLGGGYPQPGDPAYGAYSPMAPPSYPLYPPPSSGPHHAAPAAKSNLGLWLALGAVVLLAGGGAGFLLLRDRDKPVVAEQDAPQPGDPPASPWGQGSGSGSGSSRDDEPSEPSPSPTPSPSPSPTPSPTGGRDANAPMRPLKLGSVDGQLYTAAGVFRLMVPGELSMSPQTQVAPDGSASRWTFVAPSDPKVTVSVISSPVKSDVDEDDPGAAVEDFGEASGMQLTSWEWRSVQGQRALAGTYHISAKGVELAAEAVLYVKPRGVLVVLFTCEASAFADSKDFRDILFSQRISW
jgi:serine/threonine protein kinase